MKNFIFYLISEIYAGTWADGRAHQGTICGDRFINVGFGPQVIKSPHYPENLPSQTQCEWRIESAAGTRIKLTFTDFRLQMTNECQIAYLELAEEKAQNSKLCGDVPRVLITSTNKLVMTLHADLGGMTTQQGLKVTISQTYEKPRIPDDGKDTVENIINSQTVPLKSQNKAPGAPPIAMNPGLNYPNSGISHFGGRPSVSNFNTPGFPRGGVPRPGPADHFQPKPIASQNFNRESIPQISNSYSNPSDHVQEDHDDLENFDAEETGRRNLNIFLCIVIFIVLLGLALFCFLKRQYVARDDKEPESKSRPDADSSVMSVESKAEK